jgi:hypothetical protein
MIVQRPPAMPWVSRPDVALGGRELVQIGPCTLIRGDMRDVLPNLVARGHLANLVLSDPPYRLTSGGSSTGEMGGIFAKDRYDNSGDLFPMVEWAEMAPLIHLAMTSDADAVIMTSDREMQAARGAFEAAGLRFHHLLVWNKGTVTPNRWFMPNCEFALYLWKGRARAISNPSAKQLVRVAQRDVTDHPTEKPVMLMRHWMEMCSGPGDLVLDPFMGTGAAMVAALRAGRRAVGIEIDPRWFDAAVARVRDAVAAGPENDLFAGVA